MEIFQNGLGENDSLFALEFNHHAYIVLYFAKQRYCIIADGPNNYSKRGDVRASINRRPGGVRTQSVELINFYHDDECGISAILIGLELLRLYN